MEYASVMCGTGAEATGQKWYDFKGPTGTVSEKAPYETAARRAAAERLDCEEHELVCTGWRPANSLYTYIK